MKEWAKKEGKETDGLFVCLCSDCVLFLAPSKLRITSKAEYYAKIPPVFFSVTLLLNDVQDLEHHANVVEFSFVRDQSEERVTLFVCCVSREVKLEWIQTIRSICEKMVVVVARNKPAENVVVNPLKSQSEKVRASLRLRAASSSVEEGEVPVATAIETRKKHSRSKSASMDKSLFIGKDK